MPATQDPRSLFSDDDDWGDFVIGSQIPVPDSIAKPNPNLRKGAIPLSVFGFDEDEAEEPVAETERDLFGNGLYHPVTKGREVKDLIADLYGQVAVEADAEDDEDGWEFKDAYSARVGVQEEVKKSNDFLGWEKKGDAGDNAIQGVDNRLETVRESYGQLNNGGRQLGDVYAADDRCTNGLEFDLKNVGHSQCIPEAPQQMDHTENVNNKLHPSTENGIDMHIWDFTDAFLENTAITGSLGEQKTPNADVDVFKPTDKSQDTANLWENNLIFHQASTDNNGKQNLSWSAKKITRSFHEPNGGEIGIKDSMFHSVIALDDIISNLYNKADQTHSVLPAQIPTNGGPNIVVLSPDSVSLNGDSYFDDNEWEFQKAPDTVSSDLNSSCKMDESLSCGSPQNPDLDLYSRLKEKSLFLIVHHLEDLKEAYEVASLSGEQDKALKIDEDIQVLYKKLQGATVSENMYMGKHQSKDACVSQLVDFINDPHLQAFDQEYHISERISSADKDLSVAIELFEHANSVLHILGLASKEEQQTYINVWSKMSAACARELQHGAMIWTESRGANISEQILSQGCRYFLALGEIYRVSVILRASLKLYKPWVVSNQEGSSRELITSLGKCAEAWTTSGLGKSLENISVGSADLQAKTLLEFIETTHDFNDLSFQNNSFGFDDIVCRLSLLPIGMLKGVESVTWNGERYCLKLANLWANRISPDPPHLPCVLAR